MYKIGIIGANGFLGNSIYKHGKLSENTIIPITKDNFKESSKDDYEILINAATPSKKFWALNNPYDDFMKTVDLTANIVYNWNYEKLIQISTISTKDDFTKHPYALNKKISEIIATQKKSLIIRLTNLYGDRLEKGPLFDLISSKKIFVNPDSKYRFISTDFVSEWIFKNLERTGIVELGSKDEISLRTIAEKLKINAEWGEEIEIIPEPSLEPDMPSVNEIWEFIKNFNYSKL